MGMPWRRGRIITIGEGRSGKTSTLKTLLGQDFHPTCESTAGATTLEVDRRDAQGWEEGSLGKETVAAMAGIMAQASTNDGSSDMPAVTTSAKHADTNKSLPVTPAKPAADNTEDDTQPPTRTASEDPSGTSPNQQREAATPSDLASADDQPQTVEIPKHLVVQTEEAARLVTPEM